MRKITFLHLLTATPSGSAPYMPGAFFKECHCAPNNAVITEQFLETRPPTLIFKDVKQISATEDKTVK